MSHFLLADAATIPPLQSAEDNRGQDGESTQDEERLVDAVDHFPLAGVNAGGNEECGGQPGRRNAETDRHLLHRAGDGARVAGLFFADVGIGQRVHAGILQRAESPIAKRLQHDQPDRCADSDGSEEHEEQHRGSRCWKSGLRGSRPGPESGHEELGAHGRDRLGHDQQARLNRRNPKANLVEQRQEKGHSADAQACEKAAAYRRAEGANAKQTQLQQRIRVPFACNQ